MRVLVTGATGQLGSAIAAQLARAGHETVGLSRGAARAAPPTPELLSVDLGRSGVAEKLAREQPRCEAIVHAAACIDFSPTAPEVSLTNCLGTQQVLELAERWQVTSFVFTSSVPVIGRPVRLPITEDHPVDPPTAYHASKVFGEQLVTNAARAGMPAVSLRITAPVGPGTPKATIASVFVAQALRGRPLELAGEGTRCQDYVDVRDVAWAVGAAMQRRTTGLLNIASGRSISNRELARTCVEVLGSSSQVRLSGAPDPEERLRWEVSIEKAATVLGYRPRYSLQESVLAIADGLRTSMHA